MAPSVEPSSRVMEAKARINARVQNEKQLNAAAGQGGILLSKFSISMDWIQANWHVILGVGSILL
eukprot:CAMPEP_0197855066 /NCGR_PEP_ID=MMETSP1438-20131217/25906_1 /TAXON_ID=1461541 /ORGANISM="Pterosperma sp., Strain CCMP1384" /LENGTH=64 /DNA_ID=CAMNT_0043470043 /DNA_START=94 /DNA_END=285 /DNA_ORIENTATION=-